MCCGMHYQEGKEFLKIKQKRNENKKVGGVFPVTCPAGIDNHMKI